MLDEANTFSIFSHSPRVSHPSKLFLLKAPGPWILESSLRYQVEAWVCSCICPKRNGGTRSALVALALETNRRPKWHLIRSYFNSRTSPPFLPPDASFICCQKEFACFIKSPFEPSASPSSLVLRFPLGQEAPLDPAVFSYFPYVSVLSHLTPLCFKLAPII